VVILPPVAAYNDCLRLLQFSYLLALTAAHMILRIQRLVVRLFTASLPLLPLRCYAALTVCAVYLPNPPGPPCVLPPRSAGSLLILRACPL